MSAVVAPAAGRLIDPSLFVDDGGTLRLAGSRCDSCATVTFPAQGSCPRCAGQDVRTVALPESGTLWAFTVQRFTPKTPYLKAAGSEEPFAVGYVDLGGDVLVESRLLVEDIARLRIGSRAQLALEELPGLDGEHVWTFAFRVDPEGSAS